jgi:spore coat polysaccharide biosynthesis protein SpsF
METTRTPALILGTAQLGMAYGATNRKGMPSERDAFAIVEAALKAGIRDFDTARAYGESEARLGKTLDARADTRVSTKLAPLEELSDNADKSEAAQAVRASVETSRRALCRERLDVFLLDRAHHLKACGGAIWETLLSLRQDGVIEKLGVSVQSADELKLALSFRDVTHIQMPMNVFDWRFRSPSVLARIAERPEVTIHARSTLLQGLLTARSAALWPRFPGLDIPHLLRALAALVEVFGRRDVADLCFAYVRAQNFIHGLVVGAETAAQVEANAALFQRAPLKPDEVEFVDSFVPTLPETLLDPARWPRKKAA